MMRANLMVLLHPLAAELLAPAWAARVAAPAIDGMAPAELAAVAARRPWSFLHVTGVDPEQAGRLTAAKPAVAHLHQLRDAGAYDRAGRPGLALLRLTSGEHRQLGVVGDVHVDDAAAGHLRRHEHTDAAKVAALAAHRASVGVDASPINVSYRASPPLAELTGALASGTAPDVSVVTDDAVRHELWWIADRHTIAQLVAAAGAVDPLYVLDGHHRLAAAAGQAEHRPAAERGHGSPSDDPGRVLTVLFAEGDVRVFDYRRLVPRPPAATTAEMLSAVGTRFVVEAVGDADSARPRRRGEIALWLDGTWYRLRLRDHLLADHLPDRLDELVAQRHLIEPVLGVADPGSGPALRYLAGTAPLADAERQAGADKAIVALHPLPMAELRAVADAGLALPPKSTYVSPKPGAGLLLARRQRRPGEAAVS